LQTILLHDRLNDLKTLMLTLHLRLHRPDLFVGVG